VTSVTSKKSQSARHFHVNNKNGGMN